ILSADHGGHGRNHSGSIEEDRLIPWIAWGAGVRRGHRITAPISTLDTAATALWALGLAGSPEMQGRPALEASQSRQGRRVLEAFESRWRGLGPRPLKEVEADVGGIRGPVFLIVEAAGHQA